MQDSNRIRFTKAAIERLPIPTTDRAIWYDSEERGLTLCVWSSGKRVFYLYRKVDGKPERIKLGVWPAMTVEQARLAAQRHNGTIADGVNPGDKRRTISGAPTLGEVFEEYLAAPSRTRAKRARSAVTVKGYRYLFDEHLAEWRQRRVSQISRADIERLHVRIGAKRPYLANRVLALIKALYAHCLEHGYYDRNPAAGLRAFEEEQRERFLHADELPKFFEALEAEPSEKIKDFVKVALFTGQRRTNVLQMRWSELNLAAGTWTIPRTKSGKPIVVPLAQAAHEVLTRRAAAKGSGDYVFPGRHGDEHLKDPMRQWREILKRAGIKHLRIHDLRRTFGSWQAATGASLPLIGKSMGHARPDTTAIYARLELTPVRQAVESAVVAMLKAAAHEKPVKGKKRRGKQ